MPDESKPNEATQASHEYIGLCEECKKVLFENMDYICNAARGVVCCRACFEDHTDPNDRGIAE